MARVPISNPNVDSISSNHYPGAQGNPTSSSTHPRSELINNSIAEQVMNSPAYKSAHNILSQESDKSWLQRLEMIPYSVSDASSTFLDDFGLSNNFNDKQDANYQYCMEQISALMSEYQSWKNTLPITQVQQLSDAGINSAITGQGVNGSSIPNVGVGSNPSTLPSTNVGDFVGNMVDKFLNLSSGVLNWIGKYNEISLNNRRFSYDQDVAFSQFVHELSKDGIIIDSEIKSFHDLLNPKYEFDSSWYDNANSRAKRLYNQFLEIRSMDEYGTTVLDRTLKGDYRDGSFYDYDSVDGTTKRRFGSPYGVSIDLDKYTSNIADLQYKLWLKDLEYRAEYAEQKKLWHDENGYTNAEDIELFESETKASEKLIRKYEQEKMKIYVDFLKQLKKESDAGNISSRIQLMDALYELNSISQALDLGDDIWELMF